MNQFINQNVEARKETRADLRQIWKSGIAPAGNVKNGMSSPDCFRAKWQEPIHELFC